MLIGDEAAAWERGGFNVVDSAVQVGSTIIVLDPDAGPGIHRADVAGLDRAIDGLPFGAVEFPLSAAARPDHTNAVVAFDHLVAMSPSIQRTSDALVDAGLDLRRTRTFPAGPTTRRQDFFWLGDVILELVGVEGTTDPGPASLWGLALECKDLDAAAAALGDRLGSVKDAVQPGRRIATLKTLDIGISVPIALMSPHAA